MNMKRVARLDLGDAGRRALLDALIERYSGLLALLGVCAGFAVASPYFLMRANWLNIMIRSSPALVLVLGLGVIMIGGGIDLSLGTNSVFSGVVAGLIMQSLGARGVVPGILAALATGTIVGVANGAIVAYMKLNPWLVTLASLQLVQGLSNLVSKGHLVSGIPAVFADTLAGFVKGLPVQALLAAVVVILMHVLLDDTVFGANLRGLGASRRAAVYGGVAVERYTVAMYGLAGFLAGAAGLMLVAQAASIASYYSPGIGLSAIAAAVIGGVRFGGGVGSAGGMVVGTVLLAVVTNGLTLIGTGPSTHKIAQGALIMFAVLLDSLRRQR